MPQRKRYWSQSASADIEKEFALKRSSGIFASRQFPETAVPADALYDSQDIVPGTMRVRRGSGSTDTGNAYWLPSITNTPKITGLASYRRYDGTSSLIATIGGGVYKAPGDVFTKLSDPADLPISLGYSVSFSSDTQYLATAMVVSPYVNIYKRSGNTFTRLSDPATLPTGLAYAATFSSDGTYLAIAHNTSPYLTIYKRSGDTFTKLSDPATLPTGNGTGATFSSDGTYLAIAHNTSPYLTIYKRSGDTFTKLSNPDTLPTSQSVGPCFSSDGTYLAVPIQTSPFILIYKRSGDVFTKLSNPATLPPDDAYGGSFSADGLYLAVGHLVSPYVTIYKRSGDTFTKLADPAILPTGSGYKVSFSSDGTYLAVSHSASPYFSIYKRSGDTFTKLSDPAYIPPRDAYGIAFSSDGTYLAVSHHEFTGSLFLAIYKRSSGITSTTIETGLSNNNFEFAIQSDVLYYVNGDNGLRQYNGSAAAAVTAYTAGANEPDNYLSDSSDDIHNSRYITVHDNVMYLASPPLYPSRLYRADEMVGPTYFHNRIDIESERGGEIRWIQSFAGKLIVLKSDSIWAVDGFLGDGSLYKRRLHNRIGCAVGRTVQEVPGLGLVFMGSDMHFYVLRPDYVNGENVPLFRLSSHIADLVAKLLTSEPAMSSGVDGNLYVCSVNLLGGDIQKRLLVFDSTRVESIPNDPTSLFVPWGIYREEANRVFVRHMDNALEYLMAASETGIYYFEYPLDVDLADSAFFETYNLDFGEANVRKFHPRLHVVTNYESGSNTVQPAVSVDDGDYSNLDTLSSYTADSTRTAKRFGLVSVGKKVGTFKVLVNKKGYRFRYKFTVQADDYQREFQELRFGYIPEDVR